MPPARFLKPPTGLFVVLLAALALLPLPASAQGATQFVMSCPFSTTDDITPFNATYYFQGQLNCSAINVTLRFPNGTTSTLAENACGNGMHQYNASTPVRGVYTAAANTSAGAQGTCSFARLRSPSPSPAVPDLPVWLAPLLAGLALLFLARQRRKI